MPGYSFHPQKVSVIIDDVPVGYTPPVGPPVDFQLSYDHREERHPQTIDYGSVGPMWSHDWLSYVTEGPLSVVMRGQGMETHLGMAYQLNRPGFIGEAIMREDAFDAPKILKASWNATPIILIADDV